FPPDDGVGLAGEGEGTGAGLADSSGNQVEVDQREVFRDALYTLIESHGPHGQQAAGFADITGGLMDVGFGNVTDGGGSADGALAEAGFIGVKSLGRLRDQTGIDSPVFNQQPADGIIQDDVGTGLDPQV